MKALTLIQPWATLIAIGAKRIETRSWRTDYRGPLAIHAAKAMPEYARDFAASCDSARSALKAAGYTTRTQLKNYLSWGGEKWLPSSAIVATCYLVDCIQVPEKGQTVYRFSQVVTDRSLGPMDYLFIPPEQPELLFGDYTPGRFAWILKNIQPLPEPIPAKGALGLWDWNQKEIEHA